MADVLSSVKYWNGAAEVPAVAVRVWDGAAWVNKVVKYWNGSAWVDVITQTYEFAATLSDSLTEAYSGKWRTSNDYPYQGAWDGTDNNIGFVWFDMADVRAKLAGKTIDSVSAYFYRMTGWGEAGNKGLHIWGTTWASSKRGDSSVSLATGAASLIHETVDALLLPYTGGGAWGTIAPEVGEHMRDNTCQGIALYKASAGNSDYLACCDYAYATTLYRPKLKIVCH